MDALCHAGRFILKYRNIETPTIIIHIYIKVLAVAKVNCQGGLKLYYNKCKKCTDFGQSAVHICCSDRDRQK